MSPNHHILCRPLLLLPSVFPGIRVFPNESALCIRWPKCWSSKAPGPKLSLVFILLLLHYLNPYSAQEIREHFLETFTRRTSDTFRLLFFFSTTEKLLISSFILF